MPIVVVLVLDDVALQRGIELWPLGLELQGGGERVDKVRLASNYAVAQGVQELEAWREGKVALRKFYSIQMFGLQEIDVQPEVEVRISHVLGVRDTLDVPRLAVERVPEQPNTFCELTKCALRITRLVRGQPANNGEAIDL